MKLTKRQQIYNLIKHSPNKEMSIEEIAEALGMTKPQTSVHVTNMKRAGNVRNTKHGFYATIGDGYKRGKKFKRVPLPKVKANNPAQMELPLSVTPEEDEAWNEMSKELIKKSELSESRKPHKHADVVKAWADGAEIEVFSNMGWLRVDYPKNDDAEYRVKPKVIPDEVRYVMANIADFYIELTESHHKLDNLKLTFDGATRQLKYAEVLK